MNQSKNTPASDAQGGQKDVSRDGAKEQQGGAQPGQRQGQGQQEQGGARTGQGGQGGQQKQGPESGQQQGGPLDPAVEDESNRTGLSRPAGGSPNTPRQ